MHKCNEFIEKSVRLIKVSVKEVIRRTRKRPTKNAQWRTIHSTRTDNEKYSNILYIQTCMLWCSDGLLGPVGPSHKNKLRQTENISSDFGLKENLDGKILTLYTQVFNIYIFN